MARIAAIAVFSESDAPPSRDALERIAELGFAFGPTTSFDAAAATGLGAGVVWVDVTGCAHLYEGESDVERERRLAIELGARVRELGVDARVAIADGPCVAAAVARHYPVRRSKRGREAADPRRPIVVPPGRNREALRPLPLDALPACEDTRRFLAHVGMRTLGDLQKLPRESLGTRLAGEAASAMPFLEGDDRTPLRPYLPPEVPEERAELEYGVTAHEALLFVVKTLCDRMGPRLLGRAMGAARLELVFALDRALVPEGEEPRATCALALPAPLQRAGDLFAALRARVESVTLSAPALAVTLRVPELARMEARARDLFVPEAKADLALPRLTAELTAEIGEDRVGVLVLVDTWTPSQRVRLAPYTARVRKNESESESEKERPRDVVPEPTRLLPRAEPLPRAGVSALSLVMRLEAVEWWRRGVTALDYGTAWVDGMGLAWIEIDRATGERALRGWMD